MKYERVQMELEWKKVLTHHLDFRVGLEHENSAKVLTFLKVTNLFIAIQKCKTLFN